jgi:general secretion pathway protein C
MMKPYITITNLLLLAIAVYVGVGIVYQIGISRLEQPAAAANRAETERSDARMASRSFAYYRPIIDRNLFDTQSASPKPAKTIDVENLKQTELRLKLLGTATGDDRSAYAVILDDTEKKENLYRVGDEIQNAVLKLVLREKVILRVDGRDEVLEIEKIDRPTGRRIASSGVSRYQARSTAGQAPRSYRINLERTVLEDATSNMNELMQGISIQPHFEDGKAEGLRITRMNRDSILQKMGLRRGDVITGVDGQSIESVDDALSLYSRLKTADNVRVEIKRRGQPRIMDYTIR